MSTTDASQDQILSMLDSIEEAIEEETWSSSVRPPPATATAPRPMGDDAPSASGLAGFAVPAPSFPPPAGGLDADPRGPVIDSAGRLHPDTPPRAAGLVIPVRGSTAAVLGAFRWGDGRRAQ